MVHSPKMALFSAVCVAVALTTLFSQVFRLSNPAISSYEGREPITGFAWKNLPPSHSLEWQRCAPDRECARLIVPLNYSDPQGREATIALMRLPAAVSSTSDAYRGPILFNPGGPGGSGVGTVLRAGELLQKIVGPEFDIVGFDPRGVGHSTPPVSFFKTEAERAMWGGRAVPSNKSEDGIARVLARSTLLGRLAEEQDDGYLRHINTDHTVRDMLRIVEAHGREKIQYWGFSYGSVLGASFAAMFPDKVDRLIIDGVMDSQNYYDTLWSKNLIDIDNTLQSFFTGCNEAGPSACPFYAPSPEAIRQNLTNLYTSIRSNPLPIKTENTYGLLDEMTLRGVVFQALYSPYAYFPRLAGALADLAQGNGTTVFEMAHPVEPLFKCDCGTAKEQLVRELVDHATIAIMCNDGAEVPDDLESSTKYFEMMTNSSEWGDIWSSARLGCVGWPKFPKDHFQGPFNATTSHPLLLIGNTADPVTPLWAAKKMSKGFKGSVVLTQDSAGHCTVSAPSLCTQKYVREYFINGTLPEPGTICQPDWQPFPNDSSLGREDGSQSVMSETILAEDRDMLDALRELSRMEGLIPRSF